MTAIREQPSSGWQRKTGFLLGPLGWIVDRLSPVLETETALLGPLLDLGEARMHLIALALAHLDGEVPPDLALLLLRGPPKTILDISLGYRPPGLDRALGHLPSKVLAAETYRQLAQLLMDRPIARFLHHAASIDELMIIGLSKLPAVLRRLPILIMFGRVQGMDLFVDGLRCLATRANLPFEALAKEVGALDQTDQVVANLKGLIEGLPVIDTLPPVMIGPYRRLDKISEIRTLAKNWQNCLAGCVFNITDATSAVYVSDLPQPPAACLVYRQWRIGWFLSQAKGPKNIELQPQHLAQTYKAFADAGIFRTSIIDAIKNMILTRDWSGRNMLGDEI